MSKFQELRFFPVIDPGFFEFVPQYLFEQIKEINPEAIDRIYKYGSSIVTSINIGPEGQLMRVPNPLVKVAVLFDIKNEIKGFLWAEIDVVENRIFVQAYSVDRKYQSKNGEAIQAMIDYLWNLPIDEKFKRKIVTSTARPKALERRGWKCSEKILMELKNESE